MMQAELKRFHSPDIHDLESFEPKDHSKFSFLLQLFIGPKGSEGEESFDVEVCTPSWLLKELEYKKIIHMRHYIIVDEYDYDKIINFIKSFLDSLEEGSWEDLALKISRLGRWEFEDYNEVAS